MGLGPRPLIRAPLIPPQPGIISQLKAPAAAAAGQLLAEKSTTVYVGKIASSLDDSIVQSLLEACGKVKSWKRATDPETKELKGFGFCEYEDAEGVLRAIRLLHGLKIDGQELLVKGNTATQKYIEEYEAQKAKEKEKARAEQKAKAEAKKEEGEVAAEEASPSIDEDQQQDNKVLEVIMSIASDREEKFAKRQGSVAVDGPLPGPPPLPASAVGTSGRSSSVPATDGVGTDRERDREEERAVYEREREKRRELEKERREEEERRRESERQYELKLREWERIESQRAKERDREWDREREMEAERRRLCRTDLEVPESDDELEPWQRRPIRSSRRAMERRKRRQHEAQEDEVDRQREVREMSERRAKRARSEEEEDKSRVQVKEEETAVKSEPDIDPNDPIYAAMMAAARAPISTSSTASAQQRHHHHHQHFRPPSDKGHADVKAEHRNAIRSESPPPVVTAPAPAPAPVRQFGVRRAGGMNAVAAMFGEDDEEGKQKRKLKPIKYTEEELRAVMEPAAEEGGSTAPTNGSVPHAGPVPAQAPAQQQQQDPKVLLRKLMDSIPTTKDGVWGYPIQWDAYNPTTMAEKFSGWINQKVEQLLGMPEPTLVSYVTQLLSKRSAPAKLYEELSPVLDADTETFVIKLYRMVIYETEKAAANL